MVSWAGDGHVSGFDLATQTLIPTAGVLASAGVYDAQVVTRFQYTLSDLPNLSLAATAVLTFTTSDGEAGPKSASMYIVPASAFTTGYVPTPSDIVSSPQV